MINNAVIYDESNSSIETEIHRQLEITETEWKRKKLVMHTLVAQHRLNGRFQLCECTAENKQVYSIVLMTKDRASLHLQLSRYGNGACYLGTRGSPTKLLSGQNLVELRDHEEIDKTMTRLKCTRFEAMSIVGFTLAFESFRDNGERLFTMEERVKIRARDIGVYSIGFATYLNFGERRDERLHWLAYLANSKINMEGDTWNLGEFLGVKVETWRTDGEGREKGWSGRCTGVLIKKMNGDHGTSHCSQLLYLKEDEVEAKRGHSGKANYQQMEQLTTVERHDLGDHLVRVDNVFYRPYITMWLKANQTPVKDIGKPTIKECSELFDDKELVSRMCKAMSVDLGIRTLVGAPTTNEIEGILQRSEGREEEILRLWKQGCNLQAKKTLTWDLPYNTSSKSDQQIVKELNQRYYLNLSLPPAFYLHLDRIRQEFFYTVDDASAMAAEAIGYNGSLVKHLEAPSRIRNRVRGEVRELLRDARRNIPLPSPRTKGDTLNKSVTQITA